MKMKLLVLLTVALTLAITACGDKKGSDLYGDQAPGTLPDNQNGDHVDMSGPGGSGAGGINESQRPAGINPDTDVDYSVLASSTVYFEFDKSTIPASERGKLEAVKQWMDANPGRSLFLAGHADKRGTNSYGSDRPAVEGDTEDAYAKNRRVEIGVINQK
jgi:peptidoglycan-associated lipoprotein